MLCSQIGNRNSQHAVEFSSNQNKILGHHSQKSEIEMEMF